MTAPRPLATLHAVEAEEATLEFAKLKRTLAEQTAELQEYKYRCERIQRFWSLRPDEVKRIGETELADVIARETKLGAAERSLRQREEIQARAGRQVVELTEREQAVLELAVKGLTVVAMGKELHLSPATVKVHLSTLYAKLGVGDRASAVAEAIRRGLIA